MLIADTGHIEALNSLYANMLISYQSISKKTLYKTAEAVAILNFATAFVMLYFSRYLLAVLSTLRIFFGHLRFQKIFGFLEEVCVLTLQLHA